MIKVKAAPDFTTKLLKYLYNEKKNNKKIVSFIVDKQSFFAHKIVLASCSEYLKINKDNLSNVFSGFKYPVIDAMLNYCYLGEIDIDEEHYENFKKLAEKIQVQIIDPEYETKLIDKTNCLEVLQLSRDQELVTTAINVTCDNFDTLHKTHGFLSLPDSALTEIMNSENINTNSEEEVFNSVKFWVNFDKDNRKKHLEKLLSLVKWPLLSIEFIVTEVVDFCTSYPECIPMMKSIIPDCKSEISVRQRKKRDLSKIALIGSEYDFEAAIDVYDGKNDTWSLSKNFKLDRIGYVSALVDDWIIIIGGSDSSLKIISTVDYIDLKDGKKNQMKPLNQARFFFSAVTHVRGSSSNVYAIGGLSDKECLSSVERWSSRTKSWDTEVAPLLKAVYWHSAAIIGKNIYVTGGNTKTDGGKESIDTVQVYSVESNSWSYGAVMKQKRRKHSSIAIKGKLFVCGGYSQQTTSPLNTVESYDPDTNEWTDYCELPKPAGGISLCFFRNQLLCMGGYDGKNLFSNVWQYDEVKKDWKASKDLSKGRSFANAFVIQHDSKI
ncbi:kelch-like protein 25 [Arctopsyche grandis]|uniref:kelch-like protein 25 n=1 Tax=Arctopsyche grandis TaxID=121162 RepID=UPI00406D86A0